MRNVLLISAVALLFIFSGINAGSSSAGPDLPGLQLVTQLPAEVPQRITGFTYDGEKLLAAIYQGGGSYLTLDPLTLQWTVKDDDKQRRAIIKVTGRINSPTAMCFANGKLWFGGGDGQSFGVIDTHDWNVERIFTGKQRQENDASQSYSSMTYDGSHLWIAWHWCRYDNSCFPDATSAEDRARHGNCYRGVSASTRQRSRPHAWIGVGRVAAVAREGQQTLGNRSGHRTCHRSIQFAQGQTTERFGVGRPCAMAHRV